MSITADLENLELGYGQAGPKGVDYSILLRDGGLDCSLCALDLLHFLRRMLCRAKQI